MVILYAFLVIIEIVSAALLIGVIFLQKSSGAGMGTAFGGAGESIFGSRMGNVLTKATVVLAAIFLANTTLLAWVGARRQPTSVVSQIPLREEGPGIPAGRPLVPADGELMMDTEAFDSAMEIDGAGRDTMPGDDSVMDLTGGGGDADPAGHAEALPSTDVPGAVDEEP